jgi:hypothetical protein
VTPLVPVGTRLGRGRADFCRRCGTVTRHTFIVVSHEWWDCALCGDEHYTEGCKWSCARCDQAGDGLSALLTMLARAGLEPEPVDA